ncbi:MAG: glycoside hydrolase family 2 [Acholeplasmatales bacterium]|jgi:hypothetical protein|nr:glycoside hydrolase family 2 [Acholeplasmatales bacterium]
MENIKYPKCHKENYPRPSFVRDSFLDLNGPWDFYLDRNNDGLSKNLQNGFSGYQTIKVPYSYETKASTINVKEMVKSVFYSKDVVFSKEDLTKDVLLNLEGSDYITSVYVNGVKVGTEEGCYHRITFNLSPYLKLGKNNITIHCLDDYSCDRIRGKQRWMDKEFGCWYTQTTGIYKPVWIEKVDKIHLVSLKITPSLEDESVTFNLVPSVPSDCLEAQITISFNNKLIRKVSALLGETEVDIKTTLGSSKMDFLTDLWSVDRPKLYDVEINLLYNNKSVDLVKTYFGLRDIKTDGNKILLNNIPIYLKTVLDQGYFKDSGLTALNEKALLEDILIMKQMGFNGARKHQKIEDERYYYYADVLGFLTWLEIPSMYNFNSISQTKYLTELTKIIKQFHNYTSIMTYVPFNESWGVKHIYENHKEQQFTLAIYYLLKSLDSSRLVISNDGWEHTVSDILTLHHYEQDALKLAHYYENLDKQISGDLKNHQKLPYCDGFGYNGEPIMLSEFGGTSFEKDKNKGWGYGCTVKDDAEYIERLRSLVNAAKEMPNVVGFCYTQLTDVEQEVNGLLTEDRKPKVDIKIIKDIID